MGGHSAIGDVGRQGEGGYPKIQKIGETSFMDGPLYTSKESPITCRLKAILKLEESLS